MSKLSFLGQGGGGTLLQKVGSLSREVDNVNIVKVQWPKKAMYLRFPYILHSANFSLWQELPTQNSFSVIIEIYCY